MESKNGYARLDLTGKSIIVTGGGSGMGQETALLLASRGALVTVADVNEQGGEATAASIRQLGGTGQFIRTDITNEADVQALVKGAQSEYGKLDGAFNNAGIIGPGGPVADFSYEDWKMVLDINLNGLFLCLKYEIPALIAAGGGSVVNTSSTAGSIAYPNLPAYVASKHAVLGLTRQAALDYARNGVRINAVMPGSTQTPLAAAAFADPEVKAKAEAAQPIGRLGEPHEIAEMAAWLLSEASSFAVGSAFYIDGGVNAA